MRILVLIPLIAGCAAAEPELDHGNRDPLAREIAGRVAGAPATCVTATPNTTPRAVDAATLTFRQGGTLYVNRLPALCPGLRADDRLIIEVHGARYCRNDTFRALPIGTTIPGPICRLGDFVPYTRGR